jgi:hypothetical protein
MDGGQNHNQEKILKENLDKAGQREYINCTNTINTVDAERRYTPL